jgi:phosphatidylglycerophosphate synthase
MGAPRRPVGLRLTGWLVVAFGFLVLMGANVYLGALLMLPGGCLLAVDGYLARMTAALERQASS